MGHIVIVAGPPYPDRIAQEAWIVDDVSRFGMVKSSDISDLVFTGPTKENLSNGRFVLF